jgi:hypothetical protein
MTPKRIKQAALTMLLLVLAIVWWRNITLFQASDNSQLRPESEVTMGTQESTTTKEPYPALQYSPPKVNPFLKATLPARTNGSMPTAKVPTPQSPNLRDLAQLTGILERGKESQAVLRLSDGRSQVVSLQDTISGWILLSVAKEQAVFKQNKKLDTLRLGRGQ